MNKASLRSEVFALLNSNQLRAVDALVEHYEKEQIELSIDSSEPDVARRKVQAAREIRELLKPRAEKQG